MSFFNVYFFYFQGPFLAGGVASIIAWTVTWPLEYVRCQIQAGYLNERKMTIPQRFRFIIRERGGYFGLYRGLAPGLFRSFVANGCAMVVMQYAQRKVSQYGWRD
jgi:solute carrier family 25 carnitine/acylcarnitine transporter 20/29